MDSSLTDAEDCEILDKNRGVINVSPHAMVLNVAKPFGCSIRCLLAAGFIWFVPAIATAGEPVDFVTEVLPIIQQHCIRCHSPGIDKGDVSLATAEDLLDNDYIVPGESDASPLVDLIVATEGGLPEMPQQSKPLPEREVQTIRDWIDQGASWPDDVVIHEKSKADKTWWSLQPIRKIVTTKTSIDEFVRRKLAEHDLSLSPIADRRTLIRRLTFDLHGLIQTLGRTRNWLTACSIHRIMASVMHAIGSTSLITRIPTDLNVTCAGTTLGGIVITSLGH